MLASVLRMSAMARATATIRRRAERGVRNAALISIGMVFILAAAGFALAVGYQGLRTLLPPMEAAGVMAAGLAVIGVVFVSLPSLFAASARRRERRKAQSSHDLASIDAVRRGAEDLTRTLGPTNAIALALLAGIAAGRSLSKF